MPEFLNSLFEAGAFMPHGHCYLWNAALEIAQFFTEADIVG